MAAASEASMEHGVGIKVRASKSAAMPATHASYLMPPVPNMASQVAALTLP